MPLYPPLLSCFIFFLKCFSSWRLRARPQAAPGAAGPIIRVLFVAAVVVGLGFWGKWKEMERRSNSCKMTYSSPKYVPISVPGYPGGVGAGASEEADGTPGYGYRLLRYVDRKLPASEKAEPLKPRGIPVLFVPGHLGSFEQVKSKMTRGG